MTEPEPSPQPIDPTLEVLSPEEIANDQETDPMAVLQAEVDKWKDLAYRSQAELDNFRKRSVREAQEARAYANADLLRSILPIMDNFEMGLEAARAESEKSMIFMGMSMVQRQIQDFLREQGVQEIEALGKEFDVHSHEAVAQEASDTVPEGTVIRATRKGFRLKERLLRPASVIVSSGAVKAEEANTTQPA